MIILNQCLKYLINLYFILIVIKFQLLIIAMDYVYFIFEFQLVLCFNIDPYFKLDLNLHTIIQ